MLKLNVDMKISVVFISNTKEFPHCEHILVCSIAMFSKYNQSISLVIKPVIKPVNNLGSS